MCVMEARGLYSLRLYLSVNHISLTGLLPWLARRSEHLPMPSCLPVLQLWAWVAVPSFYVSAGDPNSGTYVCTTGTLPTDPSLSLAGPFNVCALCVCACVRFWWNVFLCVLWFFFLPGEIGKMSIHLRSGPVIGQSSDFTPASLRETVSLLGRFIVERVLTGMWMNERQLPAAKSTLACVRTPESCVSGWSSLPSL